MRTASTRGGFSLVEVLVAMAIVVVIGGAAAAALLSAFRLWEQGGVRARRLAAEDDALDDLGRDFACSVAAYGFAGNGAGCRFWTLAPGSAADTLLEVEYRHAEGALTRVATRHPGGTRELTRYAPLDGLWMAYAAGWDETQPWLEAWSESTNAPVRLRCASGMAARRWERTLLRETP